MTNPSTAPFLPFTRPSIDEATIAEVADVLRSGWLTSNGPKVRGFESALSGYFSGRPVRTFNSGTCTMEIGLRIAGIGPGDEVITTPNSWVATANVILEVGATPVFADIDPRSHNIDMDQVAAAISPRTRAIIPVHMCGLPCEMDQLYALAAKHSLRIIEDAAQAIGSTWKGKRLGAFGDLVSFSFQVNKNIMTAEGGCLVVNSEAEAALAERYRLQGVSRHGLPGLLDLHSCDNCRHSMRSAWPWRSTTSIVLVLTSSANMQQSCRLPTLSNPIGICFIWSCRITSAARPSCNACWI
jgi:dTDP-4-amino-4,6-dideoxygalactose transaminase